jgi:hypothetical protein
MKLTGEKIRIRVKSIKNICITNVEEMPKNDRSDIDSFVHLEVEKSDESFIIKPNKTIKKNHKKKERIIGNK